MRTTFSPAIKAVIIFLLSIELLLADGKTVYESTCAACHTIPVAGAPKIGDPEAWRNRKTKDINELYANAIGGYQGSVGFMPAKGGFIDLSDEQVRESVDYMLQILPTIDDSPKSESATKGPAQNTTSQNSPSQQEHSQNEASQLVPPLNE